MSVNLSEASLLAVRADSYMRNRDRLRRKAVQRIRDAVDRTPTLGDVYYTLRNDLVACDAVITLAALGHSPERLVEYVSHDRFTLPVAIRLIGAGVSIQIAALLRGIK